MKSRTNFIDILSIIVAVVLFLAVLALSVYGVKLSLEQFDKTCYADSIDGVVENNILLNTDFIDDTNLIKNSTNTVISDYSPLRFRSSGSWGYVVERHPLSFYDMTKTVTFTVRIRSVGGQTVLIGGRTYNSQGNSVASFGTRSTQSTSFVNLSISYDLSTLNVTNVATLGFCYYCNNAESAGLNAYCEVEWAKVEYGSTFTGYVPKDYTNYGYEQGVVYGLDNSITLKGYTRVGGLADLTSDFTLNNYHYTSGAYTEDLQSLYSFNKPNYAVYDSLDGEPDGTQIGFKLVSPSLYGNLLITCPVADSDFTVVIENTRTSSLLYIDKYDTLHYKFVGDTGVILGTWISSMVNIEFYSSDVVNIYFISNYIRSNASAWGDYPFYFPIDTSLFAVYSTASNEAFTTFEDGYQKGLEDANVDINNRLQSARSDGYNFGYDAGHRDGVLENTDYTFLGLIGAVFDAPVQAFSGLLDFNLLGVNLKSFVLALLSLSVIIIVIKIALGGS